MYGELMKKVTDPLHYSLADM